MNFDDLKELYLKKREQLGANTYKHITELLIEAKALHKRDWLEHPTRAGIMSRAGAHLRAKIWKSWFNISSLTKLRN